MTEQVEILVIGAGPTGLGAGHRLAELGHDDWRILEASGHVGGLATSFTDDAGFTYDVGGHVMFSHYPYYDALIDRILGDQRTTLRREAWVWMEDRFIPYPFQNNIRGLEAETVLECILGLVEAQRTPHAPPSNFREWIDAVMGAGIAKHFMVPYNFKVWATPAERMNHLWIGERVSVVDLEAVLRGVLFEKAETSWGPNSTFDYPLVGGTGFIWEALRQEVDHRLELNTPVVAIDPQAREVRTADGRTWRYRHLLSSMPLDLLVDTMEGVPDAVADAAARLEHSSSHIVGVGLDRPTDTSKNWIYFPEPNVPFYRVTYLSNYSPHLTPAPDQTILLTETSFSPYKPEDASTIVSRVIDGLVSTGLMEEDDRERVVTTWLYSPERSYPVPTVERDAALGTVQPWLRSNGILSRGRFGAWLYEIGNMDHSTMQGVEAVDAMLGGAPETVWIPRGEGAAGDGVR